MEAEKEYVCFFLIVEKEVFHHKEMPLSVMQDHV